MSREHLSAIIDYILNGSTDEEMNLIKKAVQQRLRSGQPAGAPPTRPIPARDGRPGAVGKSEFVPDMPGMANIKSMDFQKLAADMTGRLNKQYAMPGQEQVNQMARGLIKNMLMEKDPNITDQEVEILLNEWAPKPGEPRPESMGNEDGIPLDVLSTMLDQFMSFSTGHMAKSEDEQLRMEMPNWPERYWDIFAPETRELIKEFLEGRVDQKGFWRKFETMQSARRS